MSDSETNIVCSCHRDMHCFWIPYKKKYCGALIWRIAESLRLADFNIGGRARGHVSNTLDEIISRI